MESKAIYKFCKTLGCCDACCLRYIGIKSPSAYENSSDFVSEYKDEPEIDSSSKENSELTATNTNEVELPIRENELPSDGKSDNLSNDKQINNVQSNDNLTEQNGAISNGSSPPHKKRKIDICVSCLGVLQEDGWTESYNMVKEVLFKRGYECSTFACALSAPIATLLREKAITLRLSNKYPEYDYKCVTALKEAWKWSFGNKLAIHINKTLDSGAVSPLLITVNMDYEDDLQELEILKTVSPQLFEDRSKQKRRFVTEFTRRSVEQALENASLSSLMSAGGGLPTVSARAHCVSVACAHAPMYLGGRYMKLSRNLPQSPWILEGKRVIPSSVQEIIYGPIAKIYKFDAEETDAKLKFIAAGREDVDVRCLGEGRPFAIEITDPVRELTSEELSQICEEINKSADVIVKRIVSITKEDLIQLKKGEETKSKTYEALCIKLSHSEYDDLPPTSPIRVTPKDIENINTLTQKHGVIKQKTPIRVLHRRPLLTRTREILELKGEVVTDNPQLFRIHVRTSAGTYVKEWVHGEFGRSRPSLGDALSARVDLLALDVTAVHLDWPPENKD